MTQNTTSSWNEAFQVDYQDVFTKQIFGQSKTATMIRNKGQMWPTGGQSFQKVWGVDAVHGFGVNALGEGGDLAPGRPHRAKNFTLGLGEFSFSTEFSGKLISQAKKAGPKFFKELIDRHMKDLLDNVQFFVATRLFMNGDGNYGQISAISSNTLTINTPGPIWLRPGMYIAVPDAVTGGSDQLTGTDATRGEIIDVDREAGTITIADATGAAVNDYVALQNLYDQPEMNGLRNLIAVNTGTVQGINRATAGHNFAKPWILDLSAAALTELNFTQLNNRVAKYSNNVSSVGQFVSDYTTCEDLFEVIGSRHRYADNKNMTAGVEALHLHTPDGPKPLIPEKFAYPNELLAMRPETFVYVHPQGEEGGHWFSEDGQILRPMTASSGAGYADAWTASRVYRGNMGCTDFNANATMKNWT